MKKKFLIIAMSAAMILTACNTQTDGNDGIERDTRTTPHTTAGTESAETTTTVETTTPATAEEEPDFSDLPETYISEEYTVACGFSEGLAAVGFYGYKSNENGFHNEGSWIGYIDESGEVVIEPQYFLPYWYGQDRGDFPAFSEGLAAACNDDDKWGYIDKTGKVVIPFQYEFACDFSEGLASVRVGIGEKNIWGQFEEGYKYGFINGSGEVVIPFDYDYALNFSEGLAAVKIGPYEDGKWGYIDKTGAVVIPFEYDDAHNFSEGLASVKIMESDDWQSGRWGFIGKTGEVVIPFEYGFAGDFSEGLVSVETAHAEMERKLGFIDKNGVPAIPFEYDPYDFHDGHGSYYYHFFPYFSEGLVALKRGDWQTGGEWAYIDKTGKTVIPFEEGWGFSRTSGYFSEGLAAVYFSPHADRSNSKLGYINKNGEVVIPFEYDYVNSFSEGKTAVMKDGEWSVLLND